MPPNSKDVKPFALGDTLRDLALLRASDVDLSTLVPQNAEDGISTTSEEVEQAAKSSYEFVREARMAIKIHDRGDTETQGKRVEELRSRLEEVQDGMKTEKGHGDEMSP